MSMRRYLVPFLMAAFLTGCGSNNMASLKSYVARIKARKTTNIPPIPAMKAYHPYAFKPGDSRDPFEPANGPSGAPKKTASNGLHPDFNRPREPLESFPLDALHMVGTLQFKGVLYAMIQAPDGVIHRVTTGDYMGRHYGKVVEITGTEVDLSEIVPNGFGGWKRQPASIGLTK